MSPETSKRILKAEISGLRKRLDLEAQARESVERELRDGVLEKERLKRALAKALSR